MVALNIMYVRAKGPKVVGTVDAKVIIDEKITSSNESTAKKRLQRVTDKKRTQRTNMMRDKMHLDWKFFRLYLHPLKTSLIASYNNCPINRATRKKYQKNIMARCSETPMLLDAPSLQATNLKIDGQILRSNVKVKGDNVDEILLELDSDIPNAPVKKVSFKRYVLISLMGKM